MKLIKLRYTYELEIEKLKEYQLTIEFEETMLIFLIHLFLFYNKSYGNNKLSLKQILLEIKSSIYFYKFSMVILLRNYSNYTNQPCPQGIIEQMSKLNGSRLFNKRLDILPCIFL